MLTNDELARLARSLHDRPVLSVYLDVAPRDPTRRRAWRTELDDTLRRIRDDVPPARRAERRALASAARLLGARLAEGPGRGGARAWVGFASADDVHHAEALPVHARTSVAWRTGPQLSPYLRVARQRRPAVLAEVSSEGARLYRYADGTLERREEIRAHAATEPHYHMGSMPRQGFHTGTRGATGTDAQQRELRAGTQRMLHELARRLATLAGDDGWVLIGGTPQRALAARAALPDALLRRTLVMPELHVRSSEARIRDCAERGAAALQDESDLAAVSALLGRGGGSRRAVGCTAALRALQSGAVERMYLSERFLEHSTDECEEAVRGALEHGAGAQVVLGDAADLLDREAQGVVARLRFASPIA